MKNFFSTTDFGTGQPKIKVYEKNSLMIAEWDKDDPELIWEIIESYSYIQNKQSLHKVWNVGGL